MSHALPNQRKENEMNGIVLAGLSLTMLAASVAYVVAFVRVYVPMLIG